MVNLSTAPGISATVLVNNQDAPEYENPEEEIEGPCAAQTVVRYIEAVPDAAYSVRLDIDPECNFDCPQLVFHLSVDGRKIDGGALPQDRWLARGRTYCNVIRGARVLGYNGMAFRRGFKFSSIRTGMLAMSSLGLSCLMLTDFMPT